jgi:hypothetical protein
MSARLVSSTLNIAFAGVRNAERQMSHAGPKACDQRRLTKSADVVRRAVVGADEPRVALRLAIAPVGHGRRERAVPTRPVVVRNEVEVLVESRLGLLPHDLENLVNGVVPWNDSRQYAGRNTQMR